MSSGTEVDSKARKILIVSNSLDHEGGVVNYYNILFDNFRSDFCTLSHHENGSRMNMFYYKKTKVVLYPFLFVMDLLRFIKKLITDPSISVVQVNPSLIPVPVIRDGVYVLVAKLFRKKVVVFFRGWKYSFYQILVSYKILRILFLAVYERADSVMVLGSRFKKDLEDLQFAQKQRIQVTTTMVDPKFVTLPAQPNTGRCRILFLGRISKRKGIDDLIDSLSSLRDRKLEFDVEICGHEEADGYIDKARARLQHLGLEGQVRFLGPCYGVEKIKAFERNDLFVLPSWSEGCPNSVLEALTAGMFVVGTDVGAMRDIIDQGENGALYEPMNPEAFALGLESAILSVNEYRQRRISISEKALALFSIQSISSFLSAEYWRLISDGLVRPQ